MDEAEVSMYQRPSANSSLNNSGLRPFTQTASTNEDRSIATGVAAKFRRLSPHRNVSGKIFDDSFGQHSAGSGNESYLNTSDKNLSNRYYK